MLSRIPSVGQLCCNELLLRVSMGQLTLGPKVSSERIVFFARSSPMAQADPTLRLWQRFWLVGNDVRRPHASGRLQCQAVVGASRRRAAPGSQSVKPKNRPGSSGSESLRGLKNPVALSSSSARQNEGKLMSTNKHRPNPSIEGTSNIWLRQLSAAPHVKR